MTGLHDPIDPVVIVAAKRSPMGNMLGSLSKLTSPEIAAPVHRAVMAHIGIAPETIDEVLSGCVLQAGIGQAPARQAAIMAGIPYSAGATTINKMCGSGMKAIILGHDSILAGTNQVVLAGGMESMSQAPYLLLKARQGYRLGHGELKDHLFLDGLEDAYQRGKPMGHFAEMTAQHFGYTREKQDQFALTSLNRTIEATEKGYFNNEIASIETASGLISRDEGADPAKREKIPRLKPVFAEGGTITAANSSSISDGAASLILMRLSEAEKRGLTPLAKIIAHSTHSQAPEWFTTAPVGAIEKVLLKAQWDNVDLYEINEAFAVVTMAAMDQLHLPPEKVNIHGGACALGHPIGASGARIVVTLLHALKQHELKRGIAALCIGGGEATAIAIECF